MLKVDSLSFAYGHRRLFAEVSFSLQAGEALLLQGPNGVGKSTLLSILAGLRAPQTGSVECFTAEGSGYDDRRRFFAYLAAESNGLYLKMDANANLAFWSKLRGKSTDEAQLQQVLTHWGLGHPLLRGFPVGPYSTGMRRRLALARISLTEAPCWLLDEPTFGLDQKGIELLTALIQQHKARGGLVVMVSHDVGWLSGLIDRRFALAENWGSTKA